MGAMKTVILALIIGLGVFALVWAELMGGPPNSVFGGVGYITSERRIVQHNRDRGRREAALFRHLTNGHNRISFFDAEPLT
jgi:hypothetical protein